VLLRATIRDGSVLDGATDHAPGDIRTGTVSFLSGGRTLCTGSVGLLGVATTVASASCQATLPFGVQDVTLAVGGNYTGSASGRGGGDPVAGPVCGRLGDSDRGEVQRGAPGRCGFPTTVAVLAGHSRSGGTTGIATATFQSGGKRFQFISTGLDSFGARTSSRPRVFDLRGRATLVDITTWRAR